MRALRAAPLALVVAALALAGCTKDDTTTTSSGPVVSATSGARSSTTSDSGSGGGDDLDDFCASVGDLEDIDPIDDPDEATDLLDELVATGPDYLEDDLIVLQDTIDEVVDLDPASAADPEVLDIVTAPEVDDALVAVEDAALDECDEVISLSGSGSSSTDDTVDDGGSSGSGTSSDIDIDAVQEHLDDEYPDAPFQDEIAGGTTWLKVSDDWTIQSDELTADNAVPLCTAVATFLDDEGVSDFSVTVQGAGDTDLATSDGSSDCEPA